MFRSKIFFQKNRNILFILIVFFLTELLINPIGEFCLNDDWSYTLSVRTLWLNNNFELGNWPAMTLILHSLWGLLFVKLFGFSFTVLRFSIICLSLVTLIFTERFLFKLTNNSKISLVVTLLLLFNPLFLCLSNSYMTDISFLCFVLLSVYFFYLFFESASLKYLIMGFMFALVSVFIRQIGIIIPLSFTFVIMLKWYQNPFWKRSTLFSFFFTGSIFLLLYFFEKHVLKTLSGEYGFQVLFHSNKNLDFSMIKILEHLYVRLGLMFLYSGMFFFPILISNFQEIKQGFRTASFSSKLIIISLWVLILFVFHYFPCGNYLYNWGIGVETIHDVMRLNVSPDRVHFYMLYFMVIVLSIVGNVLLVAKMFSFSKGLADSIKDFMMKPLQVFLILVLGLYVMLLSLPQSFFDRYSLVFFLLCVIITVVRYPALVINFKITIALLSLYALFSVTGVVDYFNFNKTKTQLVNSLLVKDKIPKNRINGGFEFNMYNLNISDTEVAYLGDDKEYIVSFSDINGYSKLYHKTYFRCIPFGEDTIFVLKKNAK